MIFLDGKAVNTEVAGRDFKYYIFDWDDNILHMPTRIHMEKRAEDGTWQPVSVSTSTFALVRTDREHYRLPLEGGREAAFRDFQDVPGAGGDSTFLRDTRAALERVRAGEKPGPSFKTLRKTLREGRIFAIVTARGHAPETIRRAVRLFIDEVLNPDERADMLASLRGYRYCFDKVTTFGDDEETIDFYLSLCSYSCVTYQGFRERLAGDADFSGRLASASDARRPELAKEFAVRDFVEHIFRTLQRTSSLGKPVSVGFSDDDAGNVSAVSDYIRAELVRLYAGFKFVVYDTSDPTLVNGRKVTVAGQLSLPGF